MMLYEEGAFDLKDPVSRFIPSFADVRVYRQGSALNPATEAWRQVDQDALTSSGDTPLVIAGDVMLAHGSTDDFGPDFGGVAYRAPTTSNP